MSLVKETSDSQKSQKPILLICLSRRWGTLERRLLKDALLCQSSGFNPLIMVSSGSLLEEKVKESGLEVYQSLASQVGQLWRKRLKIGKEVSRIVKDRHISLIHCYDYPLVWPIAAVMKRYPLVPFILSENIEIRKFYTTPWRKLLTSRIDHVILSTPFLEENVEAQFALRKGKINVFGLGISEDQLKDESKVSRSKDELNLGAVVGPHLSGIDPTYPLFRAFSGISQELSLENQMPIKLHLFMEIGWENFPYYDEFKRFVLENNFGECIIFRNEPDVARQQVGLDLWISGQEIEEIEDYTITSLIQGTPVLAPRKPSTMDLFYRFPVCGETYRIDDSRELRYKCLKIIRDLKNYQKHAAKASSSLFKEHQSDEYQERLLGLYNNEIKKRKRLVSRRLSRN